MANSVYARIAKMTANSRANALKTAASAAARARAQLTLATVSAAKDTGDAKGDRKREQQVSELTKQAEKFLASQSEASKLPESARAAKSVAAVADLVVKLRQCARDLSSLPSGAENSEVAQNIAAAQRALNDARSHVDTMLPGLRVSFTTLVSQAEKTARANSDVAALERALAEAKTAQKKEHVRLEAAALAVENSKLMAPMS